MFTLYRKMTKTSMHVKPVTSKDERTKWLVVEHSPLEAFLDELRRYGLKVALHNLWWELR